ncbi:MAG TPA: GAF domain-containing protein [Macromonas sp.]|nr:GAF domain-containing protein [Macromonas sp.]
MTPRLDSIRECFEGVIPGHIATCDPDGVPNLAYLSQVQYIDNEHVALSYQFFNRTRQNVLANSPVRLLLTSHLTGAQYRLTLRYLHTEQSGALFEQMKAKLAGIAAHTGMSNVFQLLGSDIYRVLAIEQVPGPALPPPAPLISHLPALRTALQRLARCNQLESLLDTALDSLQQSFGIQHAMLLMPDESRQRLYTLASLGYPDSGVGSEVPLGSGLIGICARERTPIRIGFMSSEYSYGRAIRERLAAEGNGDALETAIPMPGLPHAASQMAVPILAMDRLLGVLYVESVDDLHFGYEDEDALVAFASQLGLGMLALQESPDAGPDEVPPAGAPAPHTERAEPIATTPLHVQHYSANDSVFINDDYLIKGVAGAILWALLSDHVERGRTSFTNKALRADPRIPLPGLSDNLEARLVLLQKRLAERHTGITLTKTGRGCFELSVQGTLVLASA